MTKILQATGAAGHSPEAGNSATATPTQSARAAGLDLPGLEAVYDALANAIDLAGPQKTELFLVKLALLNAHALGDQQLFMEQLQRALKNL